MTAAKPQPQRERGIIYVRVSDEKQSGGSSQLNNAHLLTRRHNLDVVAEVEDDGLSGDDLDRPGLVEVLAVLERAHRQGKPISWVVLDQADRLSRADSLETSELLLRMRRLGVHKVATPARVFNLFDPLDRTLLQIEADHKNNPYLKDLGRRVLNGMLDAARAGFWMGQKPPLGYKLERAPGEHGARRRTSGRLIIDEPSAALVREVFRRYIAGAGVMELARWLSAQTGKTWTRMGIYGILRRELYTGVLPFGRRATGRHARLVDGQAVIYSPDESDAKSDVVRLTGFPAIIDAETFAAARRRLAEGKHRSQKKEWNNKAKGQHAATLSPLAGLCRCGHCNAPMTSRNRTTGTNHPYLICSRRMEEGKAGCPDARHVRCMEVLQRVLTTLARELLEGDAVSRLVALAGKAEDESRIAWQDQVAAAERTLAACDARLATARRRLAEDVPADLLDDYQQNVRELKQERAMVEAELARLRAEPPVPEEGDAELLTRWLAACRQACAVGIDADGPATNALLRELIDHVVVFTRENYAKGQPTVGQVKVNLPEWLSRVLLCTAGRDTQYASTIVLVSDPDKE